MDVLAAAVRAFTIACRDFQEEYEDIVKDQQSEYHTAGHFILLSRLIHRVINSEWPLLHLRKVG